MHQVIGHVAVLIRDYDEALAYYTGVLGFILMADDDLGEGKRWVVVAPPGSSGTALLLARAATTDQEVEVVVITPARPRASSVVAPFARAPAPSGR